LRRAGRVHHLGADARVRARGGGRDRHGSQDDRRDEPGRRRRRLPARRVRARDAEQPRARLRLVRVGRARDRALVPRRARLMTWKEDAARNRDLWTKTNANYTDAQAAEKWALDDVRWGIWDVPDADLGVLGGIAGLDVVELGCGTAYMSAVFAKQGARPVGVD